MAHTLQTTSRTARLVACALALVAGAAGWTHAQAHKGCDGHRTPVQSHGCTHEHPKGGK